MALIHEICHMESKKIVMIGGPGTGKTSVIRAIEDEGYTCFHEISRDVTAQAQKEGIEQLFLKEPLLFSEMLMNGRVQQYIDAETIDEEYIFFDRGIPDVTAYMDYKETPYPERFTIINETYKYDLIFYFPVWKDIYKQDNERYESYEEALEIHEFLRKTYKGLGYNLIMVPKTGVSERVEFILSHLKAL